MKKLLKIVIIALALFGLTTVAFGAGVVFGNSGFLKPGVVRAADQPLEFEVFWEVWNVVHNNFVDRDVLETKHLTYGAVNGLISSLGDEGHTRFLTPEESTRQRTNISGTFFGIGAQVGVRDGLPVIIAPLDDSPADRAGIRAGDIIIEVDGEDVTALPLNEVVDRIRGEEGVEVLLTVFRPDTSESLEIAIIRGEITIEAVTWTMVPGTNVALIRLSQFSANITEELVEAIEEAKADGATQLVVDVRNNPGGLLEQVIKLSSQFLTEGDVLLQEDAEGNREAFSVQPHGAAPDIPLIVLINGGSASASEIFAGAIQDHERGTVVGETSFGTGTVLQPFQLSDGSALLLGTSQWLTPEGRLIRKQGIEPDIIVDIPIGANLLTPLELKEMTVVEMVTSEDEQLLKALELLDVLPQVDVESDVEGKLNEIE